MALYRTVRIPEECLRRMEAVKAHPRETWGDVLNRLLDAWEVQGARREWGKRAPPDVKAQVVEGA